MKEMPKNDFIGFINDQVNLNFEIKRKPNSVLRIYKKNGTMIASYESMNTGEEKFKAYC